MRCTALGHLKVASVDSTRQACRRTPGLARDGDTYLQVGMVTVGEAVLRQDGREALLRPGDFAIYETDRPFLWGFRDDWQLYVYTWPRATVGRRAPCPAGAGWARSSAACCTISSPRRPC